MSVLIQGMEMPIFEHQSWDIRKGADGKWYMVDTNAETSDGVWHEIIRVPPHGRLIDADELYKAFKRLHVGFYNAYEKDKKDERIAALLELDLAARMVFDNAPTIIPADKEG